MPRDRDGVRAAGGWKRAVRSLATAWMVVGIGMAAIPGCANILGLRESLDDGDCVLNSDCAPDKACIFRVCSPECQADKDCPAGQRCLRTENGAACVNSQGAGCQQMCPTGTTCDTTQNVCRNGCGTNTECLGGQVCVDGVCRGSDTGHDPPILDAGGLRDSSTDHATGSGGASGSGGAAGGAGAGASGGSAGAGGNGGTGGAAGATGGAGTAGTAGATGSGGAVGTGGAAGGTGGTAGAGTGGTVVGDGSTTDTRPPDAPGDACVNECTLGDTRCGVGQGVQTCVATGGCATFGAEVLCGGRKVCTGNAPTAACACAPRPTGCENGQGAFCSDATTLVQCAQDADQCIYKLTPTTCPIGKPCTGSHPTASCSCSAPPTSCNNQQGTFCESSTVVATCGLDGANCLAITNRVTCATGKPCTGAFGSASCSCSAPPAECASGSGTYCRGTGAGEVITCGTNSDGCLAITSTMACTAGRPCGGAAKSAACTCPAPPVGCNQAGTNFCQSSTSIATCNLDGDGCLNITGTSPCPQAKPCVNGVCTCPAPPAICNGMTGFFCSDANTRVECAIDGNGCLGISATTPCGGGKQCTGGAGGASCTCLPPPTDCPTGTGGKVCRAGNVLATCGLDGVTGCLVTTGSATCTATKPCAGSYPSADCTCPAPPGGCTDPGMQNGTYCGNSTTAVSCTTTGEGCVNGSTATCNAGQFCQQAYPSSMCALPVTLGYATDIGAVVSHGAGLLAGIPITTTNAVTLYRFGVFAKNTNGTQRVRMALYETSAGAPHTLVASTGHLTLTNGNNLVAPTAAVVLKAATTYYLMSVFEAAVDVPHDATASTTWHYIPMSYGVVFPPTLNDGMAGTTTTAQMSQSHIAYSILVY